MLVVTVLPPDARLETGRSGIGRRAAILTVALLNPIVAVADVVGRARLAAPADLPLIGGTGYARVLPGSEVCPPSPIQTENVSVLPFTQRVRATE